MSTSNDQYYDYFNNKNGKIWILEKSDSSNISDNLVFEIAGIWKCGNLVTNASQFIVICVSIIFSAKTILYGAFY